MKIDINNNKYLSEWKYVELAKYVKNLGRVIRIKQNDLSVLMDINQIETFRKDNLNEGLYTSIWHYNNTNIEKSTRLGPLYFDIDSEDFSLALQETLKIRDYLCQYINRNSVLVYFTGKKGFHIECEPVALGINPSNNLVNIYRFISQKLKDKLALECLDFSVYDARRMWRLQGSRHQDTGFYKNLLSDDILSSGKNTITAFCENQSENIVSDQSFQYRANEWFRELSYDLEIEKEKSKDFISYFNKHGSSAFKEIKDTDREFSKENLIKSCPAVERLYNQAVEKKFLEHEARLFLCSILTYNEDAIKFLHEILSNCSDYNVEKSNSHIKDWVRRRQLGIGGRPYTCERANSVGVGCGSCALEQRKKWIKIGTKYVESDEKSSPSPIRFAYKVKNKGGENE